MDLGPSEQGSRIPSEWDGFTIEKNFRGKHISIDIKNPSHVQSGVKEMTVNGVKTEGNFLAADKLTDVTKVEIVLG